MYRRKELKISAIIEARMTSSRLPKKVLMEICGKSVLEHIIERLRRSRYLDNVIVAATTNIKDDAIIPVCYTSGAQLFRGSEEDVLDRVLKAAIASRTDVIVEITGDCPLIDWRHIDYLLELYFSDEYDYASNVGERTFPDGFDVQIFSTKLLEEISRKALSPLDREHVSIFIRNHPEQYKLINWKAEGNMYHPEIEVTLDTIEDYELIKTIYENLYPGNKDFSGEDVIKFLLKNQQLINMNKNVIRKDTQSEYEKEMNYDR